ncbi:hypothetical protein [Comamonas sp. C11]|uniref:hypothetical protein n=1 Tax=Comamonas sp. C11 TaxID=2966554 RepID=UPI002111BCD8|nr:hypothetical protein [Comamonas sp. C11]UUC96118.1 hypothetical protein NOX35_12855 [Comamonas sp. C11]
MNTSYLRPFARFRAALAWARCRSISALCASRSFRSLRLMCKLTAVVMAPKTIAAATAAQTIHTTSADIGLTNSSLLLWVMLFVGCQVLSMCLFWLLIVPFHDWLIGRLADLFGRRLS